MWIVLATARFALTLAMRLGHEKILAQLSNAANSAPLGLSTIALVTLIQFLVNMGDCNVASPALVDVITYGHRCPRPSARQL